MKDRYCLPILTRTVPSWMDQIQIYHHVFQSALCCKEITQTYEVTVNETPTVHRFLDSKPAIQRHLYSNISRIYAEKMGTRASHSNPSVTNCTIKRDVGLEHLQKVPSSTALTTMRAYYRSPLRRHPAPRPRADKRGSVRSARRPPTPASRSGGAARPAASPASRIVDTSRRYYVRGTRPRRAQGDPCSGDYDAVGNAFCIRCFDCDC